MAQHLFSEGTKVLDYRRFQVLKTLAKEGDWLTQWKLTRKALDHLTPNDRQILVTEMIDSKYMESRKTRQPEGPGATATQYRITPTGLKVYRETESVLERGGSLTVAHSPRRRAVVPASIVVK